LLRRWLNALKRLDYESFLGSGINKAQDLHIVIAAFKGMILKSRNPIGLPFSGNPT
jgi:hypothetical protein